MSFPQTKPIKMSDDQQHAFDVLMKGDNAFLTGGAGTGKSHLLKEFCKAATQAGKSVVRVASTGAAASLIEAVTAHKFFGLSVHVYEPGTAIVKDDVARKIAAADVFIFEECSMARYDVVQQIIEVIAKSRDVTDENPFGAQMVMVGDFAQLPAVLTNAEKPIYSHFYGSKIYAFEHPVWASLRPLTLIQVHRQQDAEFAGWLSAMRNGEKIDLSYVNDRVSPRDDDSTVLVSTNAGAKRINDEEMSKVKGDPVVFTGVMSGQCAGMQPVVPPEMTLRKGARVIICANDSMGQYVNGSTGVLLGSVRDPADGEIKAYVQLDDRSGRGVRPKVFVGAKTWENVSHVAEYDDQTGNLVGFETKTVGTYDQIPLLPAWAITIHRSQGMSIDKLHVDPEGIFEAGQAYVAISRATSIEGLTLGSPLHHSHIIANRKVVDFNRALAGLDPIPRPKGLRGLVRERRENASPQF